MWLVLGSDREAPLFALRTVYHFLAVLGTEFLGGRRLGGTPRPTAGAIRRAAMERRPGGRTAARPSRVSANGGRPVLRSGGETPIS